MYFHVPACYLKPTYTRATVLPVLHLQTSANVILRRGAKSGEILTDPTQAATIFYRL